MSIAGIKTAFVIMPFSSTTAAHTGEYWTQLFENFLKPQLERRKYVCRRSQAQPESIVKGVLKDLNEADLVLAVLTDYNANVWYELGIRHALRKGTIMLIESGQKLPFDISAYGVLIYEDSLSGLHAFESSLDEFIAKIEREQPIDSPVQEFLGPMVVERLDAQRHYLEELLKRKIEEHLESLSIPVNDRLPVPGQAGILWVDDNPANNEVFIEEYRSRGIHFDLALSTDQALQFLGENPRVYVLIISDMNRGAKNDAGLELLSEIRTRWRFAPPVLIYCSGRSAQAFGDKAKELGAVEVTTSVKEVSLWIENAISSRSIDVPRD
jgi:CheY-like chemotaxis protein